MVENQNISYFKRYKKEMYWSFIFITIISALIVLYGYLFKFQIFVYSLNKILGVSLCVFLVSSIIAVLVSLGVAAEDHYGVDEPLKEQD